MLRDGATTPGIAFGKLTQRKEVTLGRIGETQLAMSRDFREANRGFRIQRGPRRLQVLRHLNRAAEPVSNVAAVSDVDTAVALEAERVVVDEIGGGCQVPLGAVATIADGTLELLAVVASPDGSRVARATVRGPASQFRALGRRAADELAAAGGREILDGLGIRR